MRSCKCDLRTNSCQFNSGLAGVRHKPSEEVSQVHKLAVRSILDVYYAPAVLTTPDSLSINNNVTLRAHDSERDDFLWQK